ncbi:sensor domain-containing diguanylate cyclase [Fundidesulfovibrio terrae]|uniref:sensor domain-containing diguanylate cyclase n=1 Tax=Fundidesulfovibrio terrae TaxID=2922866 RepID=UPI001FAF7DAA|nr:sensor domain-containing diguanylate cyclase [Fundidesulfovibrio terrae]
MRTRIAIVLTPIVLVAFLWGVVAYWTVTERAAILADEEDELVQLDAAVAENVNGLFRLVELALVSARHWMAAHPDEDPANSPEFIDLVESFRRVSRGEIDIRLVTKSGDICYVPPGSQERKASASDRDYFLAQQDPRTRGLYIAGPVKSRVTGKWGLPISMPVEMAGGGVSVVFGAVDLAHFMFLHEAQRRKPGGSILLMRTDGVVLSRVPFKEELLGRSLADTPGYILHMGRFERGLFVSQGVRTDWTERLVSFQRLAGYPVVVAVTSGMEDVLKPWAASLPMRFGILCVVTLGVFAIVWKLNRAMALYDATRRELEFQATTDELTGLANRRSFLGRAAQEVERARRFSHELSLLVIDIDHFKSINDRFGHGAGDLVLRHVAQVLRGACRNADVCARLGGEEFAVLLVETGGHEGAEAARRLCATVREVGFRVPGGEVSLSVSVGLSSLGERNPDFEKMFRAADEALYRAKNAGRDRVVADV